jgi:hypothetical protein
MEVNDMTMRAAKRGSRPSSSQITINDKIMTISFSAGFLRDYNLTRDKAGYVRIGYDVDTNEIGLDFLREDDQSGEAMKLSYTQTGTAASCPIRSLLTSFSLKVQSISGVYKDDAIAGPTKIAGFAEKGFLLKVSMRDRGQS